MRKPAVITLIVAAATLLLVYFVMVTYWNNVSHVDTPKLISAVQKFVSEEKRAGRSRPTEVSVQYLVEHHYLSQKDVAGLEGMDVVFLIEADETKPQQVIMRAKLADGTVIESLANGSAQFAPQSPAHPQDKK